MTSNDLESSTEGSDPRRTREFSRPGWPLGPGRIVHYVARGSADGRFPSVCRAAMVTEAEKDDPFRLGLCVVNPTGLFFHSLADHGGVEHDAGDPAEEAPGARCASGERAYLPGTWHEPERV